MTAESEDLILKLLELELREAVYRAALAAAAKAVQPSLIDYLR